MNVRLLLFLAMSAGIVVTCHAQQNTRWEAMGNGLYSPLPYIYAVTAVGSDVFVGGIITRAGNLAVNNIARWNWQGPELVRAWCWCKFKRVCHSTVGEWN